MRNLLIVALIALTISGRAWATQIPTPLLNIKVTSSVSESSSGLLRYQYSIANPKSNTSDVFSFSIFLGQDPASDMPSPVTELNHCKAFRKTSSANILQTQTVTAVGSAGPPNWGCGYETRAGFPDKSYGLYAREETSFIKPGKTESGIAISSYGLPAIRDVLVEPYFDVDLLPAEYESNLERTIELHTKVQWLGKTVGPKAPPKVFVKTDFMTYLTFLKDESYSLGWITGKGLKKELDKVLASAKSHLDPCNQQKLKEELSILVDEIKGCKRKGMSSEARALLGYNAKYFISQLPRLTKSQEQSCEQKRRQGHGSHDHHSEHDGDRDR